MNMRCFQGPSDAFDTQDLFEAIIKNDKPEVNLILENVDVNHAESSITPLWVAITGCDKVRQKATNNGDYNMTELLLKRGANPNIKCITVPPIYIAVVEDDIDIVTLLLNQGAYPNEYKIDRRVESTTNQDKYINNCKLPIMHAIENSLLEVVESLIAFDSIFNKQTIIRAKKMVKVKNEIYRDSENSDTNAYFTYRMAKDIVTLLEEEYDEELHEAKAKKYMEENSTSYNNCSTFFVGLQPFVQNSIKHIC